MSVSWKYRLEYFSVRSMAGVVRCLPRSVALTLGSWLGRLMAVALPGRYRLAEENMKLALPELTSVQVDEKVRANFRHFGIFAAEMLRLDKFRTDDLERYFDLKGLEHLIEARKLGRGVILLTGHFGFWEAGSYVLPACGIPCDMVAKPMRNPLTDDYFAGIRTHFGGRILNSYHGARRILRSLRANHAVAILIDQHPPRSGSVKTDFFGQPARTTTVITSMAMKYRIPIVPMFCLRQPDNRYQVWTEPMLLLQGEEEEDVVRNTQLLNNIIETAIRRDVTQWFWMHKRWRVKKGQKKKRKKRNN